jgi:hypothetical protein
MVLLVDTGDAERFYVLSRDRREDRPRYWLRQWRTECVADIAPDGPSVPGVTADAVTRGVPIPQDEHLFGWKNRDHVSALIVFYTRYAPEHPEPVWAVMPLVSTTTTQWPPFAGESALGRWFWDYHSAGSVVSVDGLVGANPDTVFWVNTQAILGSDCCVVAHDIASPEGFTLPRGRYVYQRALAMNKPVPTLGALLADDAKADLAPRFSPPSQ